jgi:hypothetical protein
MSQIQETEETVDVRDLVVSQQPLLIDDAGLDSLLSLAAMASASPFNEEILEHLFLNERDIYVTLLSERSATFSDDAYALTYFHQVGTDSRLYRHMILSVQEANAIPDKAVVDTFAGILGFSGDVGDMVEIMPAEENHVVLNLSQLVSAGYRATSIH